MRDSLAILLILSWFLQMGVHEGMHAYAASWRGDDTAERLGKKTFDPFRHIEWRDPNAVILGVALPVVTALQGFIPMGMAWVPVNPARFKHPRRDHAIVSFAGPAGNFALAAVCLPIHALAVPFAPAAAAHLADDFARCLYVTSLLYGVFNLVPIPPLDGSKVLYYFLPSGGRSLMEQIAPYGFWILIALFWVGDAGRILDPIHWAFLLLWHIVA